MEKSPILEKIASYNAKIQSTLQVMLATFKDNEVCTKISPEIFDYYVSYVTQHPDLWRNVLRPVIIPVMAELNAQAKNVKALAMLAQYQRSNDIGTGKMLDYTKIIDIDHAELLYVLEFTNFTVPMGKSDSDWFLAGEGLFFSLYFDVSHPPFDVGVVSRPLPTRLRTGQEAHNFVSRLIMQRSSARNNVWEETYPPLEKDRPDFDAEVSAFLSASALVAQKDAAYKGAPQQAWITVTKMLKQLSGVADIDSLSIKSLQEYLDYHAPDFQNDVSLLNRFFSACFFAAQKCTALRVDLMNDKRLPSIARVVTAWYTTRVVPELGEWILVLAYSQSSSNLYQDIRDMIVLCPSPIGLYRKYDEEPSMIID